MFHQSISFQIGENINLFSNSMGLKLLSTFFKFSHYELEHRLLELLTDCVYNLKNEMSFNTQTDPAQWRYVSKFIFCTRKTNFKQKYVSHISITHYSVELTLFTYPN